MKLLWTAAWMQRKRWADPVDLNRCIFARDGVPLDGNSRPDCSPAAPAHEGRSGGVAGTPLDRRRACRSSAAWVPSAASSEACASAEAPRVLSRRRCRDPHHHLVEMPSIARARKALRDAEIAAEARATATASGCAQGALPGTSDLAQQATRMMPRCALGHPKADGLL